MEALLERHNKIYFTAGTVTVIVLSKFAIQQRDSMFFPVYGGLKLLWLITAFNKPNFINLAKVVLTSTIWERSCWTRLEWQLNSAGCHIHVTWGAQHEMLLCPNWEHHYIKGRDGSQLCYSLSVCMWYF